MPTPEHQLVKPEVLAATAVGMLAQELIVPRLFQRQAVTDFRGAENDTLSVPVEGLLPFHDYAWRNDRSNPIIFDEYKERKIAVTFGGNVYSAVKVTDEQYDFDLTSWAKLLNPQARAVGRGLQRRAVKTLVDRTYAVTIGNAEQNLRGALVEARKVLNRFNVPDGPRYLLVGSDFESALLNDEKLVLAQNVGDVEAVSALRTATIGQRAGFTVVVDQSIPADAAYAMVDSAFIFVTGAPSVPQSVPFGATASYEDIALRWVRDYDSAYMQDRSVVNTYAGFRAMDKDVLVGYDPATGNEFVGTEEHFVRAIKLTLDGSSNYPPASSELARISGVSDAKVFTPTGPKAETDPANA